MSFAAVTVGKPSYSTTLQRCVVGYESRALEWPLIASRGLSPIHHAPLEMWLIKTVSYFFLFFHVQQI